jgi:quinol monooxygenase YgiN
MALLRMVRMQFRPDAVEEFLLLFDGVKQQIRNFPGCMELKLMRDADHPAVFYTYSRWEAPEFLEQYRNSAFFAETWRKTKALFAEKAMAFSLQEFQVTDA